MTTTQTFRASTLAEARRAAEGTLGAHAIILTTRKVRRSGLAGLLGSEDIEIVATPADAPVEAGATYSRNAAVPNGRLPFAKGVYAATAGTPAAAEATVQSTPSPVHPTSGDTREDRAARAELSAMRSEIRMMKSALATPMVPSPEIVAELIAVRDAVEALTPPGKKSDRSVAILKSRGLEGTAATSLARALKSREGEDAPVNEKFRDALADVVKVAAWPLAGEGRRVIALVGFAGVGKTTTAAKLAARARMDGKTVAFVACDTYRVGAVEQLQRYGRLLGARVTIAKTRTDLAAALAVTQADVVIVDTSGRSPDLQGLEGFMTPTNFGKAAEAGFARHVLLCLPAALRASDAARVVRAFAPLSPTALAITKLDETDAPSGLVHGTVAGKFPVSVLCFGQRVPEDVAPATTAAILDQFDPRLPSRAA